MAVSLWDLKRLETNQAVEGTSAQKQARVIIAEAKAIFRVFSQLRLDVTKSFFPDRKLRLLCLSVSSSKPPES